MSGGRLTRRSIWATSWRFRLARAALELSGDILTNGIGFSFIVAAASIASGPTENRLTGCRPGTTCLSGHRTNFGTPGRSRYGPKWGSKRHKRSSAIGQLRLPKSTPAVNLDSQERRLGGLGNERNFQSFSKGTHIVTEQRPVLAGPNVSKRSHTMRKRSNLVRNGPKGRCRKAIQGRKLRRPPDLLTLLDFWTRAP